jgi:amino acid adenylation domain-containing protein/non-ribosomal peptide synthase protein (TIGR01720 family)
MKQFIQKLADKNLFLKEANGDLILNGKKGKLTKEDIQAIKNDHTIVDFIKKNKAALIDYLKATETPTVHKNKSKNISAIYGLSPMQEGMLFHELYDASSIAYTNQMVMNFPDGLDIEAFQKSCNYVLKNHSILRTGFFHEDLSMPIQSVFKEVEMPITILDFSQLSKEAQEKAIAKAIEEDQHTSFDLTVPPLMRVTLFKTSESSYQMVWTHHHIIIDGWSMPLILSELLEAYDNFCVGKTPKHREEDQYKDYIDYITSKDKKEEATYWKNYLGSLEEGSLLPFVEKSIARNKGVGEFQNEKLLFDVETTKKITTFCQAHHLTANTLVQGVWSFLLAKYTGKNEVVFGVTVSGRPSDFENTEERVGLYINTLPLYAAIQHDQSVLDFLKTIQKGQTDAREYQYSALSSVKKWSGIQSEFFDSLLIYESYPTGDLDEQETAMEAGTMDIQEKTNYLLTFKVGLGNILGIDMDFNASLLEVKHVEMIKAHIEIALLDFIKNAEKSLSEVSYLTEKEQQLLIEDFNQTETDYTKEKTVIDFFRAQVAKTPEATAICFEDQKLTYKELDEKSDALAQYLLSLGLAKEELIPLCVDRSLEMMIAILGIQKAGAAYVPVDPNYPQDRIDFMLQDVKATKVVTTSNYATIFSASAEVSQIHIDNLPKTEEKLEVSLNSQQLAYVFYTSGSTGTPKGVMIEHKSLLNFLLSMSKTIDREVLRLLSVTAFTFDISILEFYYPLITGGQVCIANATETTNPEALGQLINTFEPTCIQATPSRWQMLKDYGWTYNKDITLLSGGEPISKELTKYLIANASKVWNMYGPTETTIWSCEYELTNPDNISIGKPIDNTQIYLLDDAHNLVPTGIAGELCIGGDGLARGYLNRSELTAEKFIPNPFKANERIYKTGDLARWLPDGNLEFIGRKDDQVKLRGYRIELGEIEAVLDTIAAIQRAVVLVKKDTQGNAQLVGYISTSAAINHQEIQEILLEKLPEYMVPKLYMQLEEFPLTPNGKVDRKSLPELDESAYTKEKYAAPTNDVEATLAQIWQKLLGIEQVGIHDNFFNLGGDSIITIQLVSRAKREGYTLSPKDVFEQQTIQNLANLLQGKEETTSTAAQGILKGNVPLLPIQKAFLSNEYAEMAHYNQSLLLNIKKSISPTDLETITQKLIEQHDALRLVFQKTNSNWTQTYTENIEKLAIEDISTSSNEALSTTITEICQKYQQSFQLETGNVVKFVFIQTPNTESHNRLFIAAHHLVIDGVSWRILLDDLHTVLTQIITNKPITLGEKSSSYRQFGEALTKYAESNQLQSQIDYWEQVANTANTLPVASEQTKTTLANVESHQISLDTIATENLLKNVNQAYSTEINDILLSTLLKTLTQHFEIDQITVGMETHGRENLFPQIDISNTVGWFTNIYPLVLRSPKNQTVSDFIKSTKEQIKMVPENGIGFGILRYLSENKIVKNVSWNLEFNYLGQVDNVLQQNNEFQKAIENAGENIHPNTPTNTHLAVNSIITNGMLQLSFDYASNVYDKTAIETIATAYLENLQAIIKHCTTLETSVKTPSDYQLQSKISYEELDAFFAKTANDIDAISSIYELSPMQEGMLFHSLYDENVASYTNQMVMGFSASFDVDIFKQSCEYILKNYSILRSGFYYENIGTPIQMVYNSVETPIETVDFTQLSEEETEAKITEFINKEQQRNFDFKKPPLMRIYFLQLQDGSYKMVWTYHHIILDGWSMPILMNELLETYDALEKGNKPIAKKEDIYQEYIEYIRTKDVVEEETHWRNYLSNLEEGTLLPFIAKEEERNSGIGDFQSEYLAFDADFTKKVKDFCKANHITTNTLMQATWAYLLAQYTAKDQVVYGVTVSGRPSDFENTEERVGLYINTIPLYTKIDASQKITDFLAEIQQGHTASREFQYSALSDVKKWSGVQGEFFDSLFVFENYPVDETENGEQSIETTSVDVKERTNYPITLEAIVAHTLNFKIDFNASILEAKDVKRIKNHLKTLLESFVSGAEFVGDLNYLTSDEHAELLDLFNTTSVEFPREETIVSLFEAQVAKTPNAVAAVYEDQQLTYKELDEKSNQFAAYLLEKGVTKETFVPICVDRSLSMIIGILGIVKAGGVYVPIDPNYPQERVDFILNDLNAQLVVTENASAAFFSENIEVINLDTISEELANYSKEKTKTTISPEQLLYVIYTSGTTGTPKGVLVSHQNVVRLFYNEQSLFDFNETDVWSMFHSYNFDFSVWEMYGAILFGGKLVVVPTSYTKDPELFGSLLEREGVTILNQTPSSFSVLQERVLQNNLDLQVRYVIFGGEALHPQIVKNWKARYESCKMINMYGITETTVHVTYKEITSKEIESNQSNIGVPIPTLGCVILDDSQKLVPTGVQGELYITGDGVTRGYLNRDELTQERFVTLTIGGSQKRYYRSGDLAKINNDGELEYLGRKDDQVKIRGYRIELGEIDTVLNKSEHIKKGVTLAQKDDSGIARLLSFIIPAENYQQTEVLAYLQATLPSYMVPAILIELEEFPVTSNGKIDKKNLLQRETIAQSLVPYVAPRNEMEMQLADMWKKVLKLKKIGVHDRFFDIGGNSIDVIKLVSEIQRTYEIDIPLRVLFDVDNIADLAKYIKLVQLEKEDNQNSKVYDL